MEKARNILAQSALMAALLTMGFVGCNEMEIIQAEVDAPTDGIAALETEADEEEAVVEEDTEESEPEGEIAAETTCADPCGEEGSEQVLVCHVPPGNPERSKTLCVDPLDAADHEAHGDACGECSVEPGECPEGEQNDHGRPCCGDGRCDPRERSHQGHQGKHFCPEDCGGE